VKKIKKILLLFLIPLTSLILISCGGNGNSKNVTPIFIVKNDVTKETFVDEINDSKKVNLEAWFVLFNKELRKINIKGEAKSVEYKLAYDKNFISEDQLKNVEKKEIKDAVAKKYTYLITGKEVSNDFLDGDKNKEIEFIQYKKDSSNNNIVAKGVNFIELDNKNNVVFNGALLEHSFVYDKKLKVYNIKANGNKELIDDSKITYSKLSDEDLIKNRKYENYTQKKIDLLVDGEKILDFNIWIAADNIPLNLKVATFWNWVFLQVPITLIMSFIGGLFFKSFAVAILLTTILVRTLAWPIYAKSNDLSLKMSLAQPDVDRLNRKYATRKDPESMQKKQMEMMQIYKKHKINILGCLTPLLQMPIFFAMYEVARRITIPGGQFYQNVGNHNFFGINLTGNVLIFKIIFSAIVGLTMFLTQYISMKKPAYAKSIPTKNKDPQAKQTELTMKIVSYFTIFMMVFMSYTTYGLSIAYYWIVGNIYTVFQTLINRKLNEKKYKKMEEEKLYGKSRIIIDSKKENKK